MTIYSLYIFDRSVLFPSSIILPLTCLTQLRHCDCVYYQDWHRTRPLRPPAGINFRPGVHRLPLHNPSTNPVRESIFSNGSGSAERKVNGDTSRVGTGAGGGGQRGLPFDEEAKLVYGVILSLRNMVKKLSGRCVSVHLNLLLPSPFPPKSLLLGFMLNGVSRSERKHLHRTKRHSTSYIYTKPSLDIDSSFFQTHLPIHSASSFDRYTLAHLLTMSCGIP